MESRFIESTVELIDFIADSPSCFHVVENAAQMLVSEGFSELDEKKDYKLEAGKCYFVRRNGSALIAFRMPLKNATGYSIISAHTDSPCLKLKSNPEIVSCGYTTLNVETYGGMLVHPWFDRPLTIAGRVYIRKGKKIECRLFNADRELCVIPSLCIHQNRDANRGVEINLQKEMMPLLCQGTEPGVLKKLIADELEVDEKDIVDSELFVVNYESGKLFGLDNEFFTSPRIDDLQCAFAALKALCSADSCSDKIQMVTLFDNEEIGSMTKQGADSDFLVQTAGRIACEMKWDYQKQCRVQASSFMMSADNGHSVHPNYTERCDITNKPVMNGGIVIKYSGNQKYSTDGYSASVLRNLFDKEKIPYQVFHNNTNLAGGSTLGNISASQFSVPTVDVGAVQLAMHSPNETGGTKDTLLITEAMQSFLNNM